MPLLLAPKLVDHPNTHAECTQEARAETGRRERQPEGEGTRGGEQSTRARRGGATAEEAHFQAKAWSGTQSGSRAPRGAQSQGHLGAGHTISG